MILPEIKREAEAINVSQVELRKKKFLVRSLAGSLALALPAIIISACSDQAKAKPNLVFKAPEKPGVVAKIAGKEITEEMLIGDDKLEFFELEKRKHEMLMDRLNKLMVDTLVGAEATKAKLSLDEYIDKKVVGGTIKISDKDYKAFITEKHIPETQINPQIKEKIMNYLQTLKRQDLITAHVAKLTRSSPVEVYMVKPKLQIAVEAGNAPQFGKKDAAVQVIEFSDFQCPFCAKAATTVSELKKKYGSKINLAFRQYPLPMHQEARPTAEASLCVNEQSSEKFWKFHDLAFKNYETLNAANLEKFAKDSGADVAKFKECVASKKFAQAVQSDLDYGNKIGVKSTPTFFINGQIVSGALPLEAFSEIIDEELKSAKN